MEFATLSKKGDREINEDYLDVFESGSKTIFVLADGLGGHGYGEVASKEAVIAVKKSLRNNEESNIEIALSLSFQEAHNTLKKYQNEVNDKTLFKTTMVILIVDNYEVIWGHIGDSRIYHFEQQKLIERSMDHSVPQMLVNAGSIKEKDIRRHEDRNRLTRVLGAEDDVLKPYITKSEPRNEKASFLLCSDGLWELVNEKKMEKNLKKSTSAQNWIDRLENIVINKKDKNKDNYSAIAVVL